jgi:hypothetical protein
MDKTLSPCIIANYTLSYLVQKSHYVRVFYCDIIARAVSYNKATQSFLHLRSTY